MNLMTSKMVALPSDDVAERGLPPSGGGDPMACCRSLLPFKCSSVTLMLGNSASDILSLRVHKSNSFESLCK